MSSPPVAPRALLTDDLLPAVDGEPAGVLVSTPEGLVTADAGWHRLTRRVLPPGTREGLLVAVHPDDRPAAMRLLGSSDAEPLTACDVRLISGDGSIAAVARLEVHAPPGWPPGTTVIAVVTRQPDRPLP